MIRFLSVRILMNLLTPCMFGGLQGEFDPTQTDKHELQKLKEEHGDGPVVYLEPERLLTVILTKWQYNSCTQLVDWPVVDWTFYLENQL